MYVLSVPVQKERKNDETNAKKKKKKRGASLSWVHNRVHFSVHIPVHSPVHGPVQSPESRFCTIPYVRVYVRGGVRCLVWERVRRQMSENETNTPEKYEGEDSGRLSKCTFATRIWDKKRNTCKGWVFNVLPPTTTAKSGNSPFQELYLSRAIYCGWETILQLHIVLEQ